jgi:hypothetical protein
MRLDDEQESSNFEIQQGGGGFGGGFGAGETCSAFCCR